MIKPGEGEERAGDAVGDEEDDLREQEAEPGQRAQHVRDRLRGLVALDGADQPLEHAAVEGEARGSSPEDAHPDEGRPGPGGRWRSR